MIKRFVLNWIRNHMSHNHMTVRDEILTAINDGCRESFYEDTPASRISWIVGELIDNDEQFVKENAPIVLNAITHEVLHRVHRKTTDQNFIR